MEQDEQRPNGDQVETDKLVKKIQKRGTGQAPDINPILAKECIVPTNPNRRRRSNRRPRLSTSDKVEIVHKVINQHHSHKEVAKEFRVTQGYVALLCSKTRKNPKFFGELVTKDTRKEQFKETVVNILTNYIEGKKMIYSVQQLQEKLLDEHSIRIKPWKLKEIMRDELKLRYRKIVGTSWQGNSPQNLILR